MSIINVKAGSRSYDIVVGYRIISRLNKFIQKLNLCKLQAVVVTNPSILSNHRDYFLQGLRKVRDCHFIVLPASEKTKSWPVVFKVLKKVFTLDNRGDVFLVSFGGGVIGDLTGFCAAIYKRGIPYIQIPTTLLGMVDSSIGGKTGIDLEFGKNLVGAFYQPYLVFSDLKFLETLPVKEIKNGISEIVKCGIITDPAIVEFLEENSNQVLKFKPQHWLQMVVKCAQIKARIVEEDELDNKGVRAILNFGHTLGHALESALDYSGISHGEAVAWGMVAESIMANRLNILKEKDLARIVNLITALDILPQLKVKPSSSKILSHLKYDKKAKMGELRFVLPTAIGKVKIVSSPPPQIIKDSFQETIKLCIK